MDVEDGKTKERSNEAVGVVKETEGIKANGPTNDLIYAALEVSACGCYTLVLTLRTEWRHKVHLRTG